MDHEFYTHEEAANVLGITPQELEQMRSTHQITGLEQGGAWQYRVEDVQVVLRARTSAFDDSSEFNAGSSEYSVGSDELGLGSAPQVVPEPSHGSSAESLELVPLTSMPPVAGSEQSLDLESSLGSSEQSLDLESSLGSSEQSLDLESSLGSSEQSLDLESSLGSYEQSVDGSEPGATEPYLGEDLDVGFSGQPGTQAPLPPNQDSLDFGAPLAPTTGPSNVPLGELAPPKTGSSLKGRSAQSVLKIQEESLDFGQGPPTPPGAANVDLGDIPLAPTSGKLQAPASKPPSGVKKAGDSDVRLDMETGSFEFSLGAESAARLSEEPTGPPTSSGKPPSSQKLQGLDTEGDSDVRLDFDPGAASPDDDLISIGDKPDSDVRLDPVSEIRKIEASPPLVKDLMATEQIDLDEELRRADEASMVRRPRTAPPQPKTKSTQPKPGQSQLPGHKTQAPQQPTPTMLPTTSPFELSEEDLDLGSDPGAASASPEAGPSTSPMNKPTSGSKLGPRAGGSEFELTLAPEDDSPLKLGDDEDVELGGAPAKGEASSRAELSGINLQVPADSGISLEEGKSSDDSVDFELTLDDDSAGPKTLRGKLSDSDSEFELTLDESGSSASLPKISKVSSVDASGEQKDIFETDFDMQASGAIGEESGSQAIALDEPDTDLESSDFDLAIEEESGSQVVPLPDDSSSVDAGAPERRSKVSKVDQSLSEVDQFTEDEIMMPEEAPAEEEFDEAAIPTVPSAQAEWGIFPLIMMVPCVLVMVMCGLMAYELVHNMWGYHQTTKPSGLLVESFAKMFDSDDKN